MDKIAKYCVLETSIKEECNLSQLPYEYYELQQYLKSSGLNYPDIKSLSAVYNKKSSELENLKKELFTLKHSEDMILFQQITMTKPPLYLKKDDFNYKAILLYFMRKFKNLMILSYKDFEANAEEGFDLIKLEKYFSFNKKKSIYIGTQLDTLLHLINIKNFKRSIDVIEKILYETITYGDHVGNLQEFSSKVASFAWLYDTLTKPDYVYDKNALVAEKLKADLVFIKETGTGSTSQKYMHHLVALRRMGGKYVLISQFPLEKDRSASKLHGYNISYLHKKVDCKKAIYIRKGKTLPRHPTPISSIEKLKNIWE